VTVVERQLSAMVVVAMVAMVAMAAMAVVVLVRPVVRRFE